MPHIKDSDMEELGEQVLGKLHNMTDGKYNFRRYSTAL